MTQILEEIYRTGTVVGQSGKVYDVHSGIDPEEGDFVANIIRNDPGITKTLEVGCAFGLSTLHICLATRERSGASHTIIDPLESTEWDGVGIRNLENAGIDFYHLIETGSEFALPQLAREQEGEFDLVFVDGIHTFDHTLLDCFYATRLLRVGGVLVLDDVSFPAVKRVVDFLRTYPCYEEHGSVGTDTALSWRNRLTRALLSPIDKNSRAKVLPPGLYQRIYRERSIRMIALKKVKDDERNWDWHDESF